MRPKPTHAGIVALPFEVSTSFLKGTLKAPERIIEDLEKLDDFSLLLGRRTIGNVPYKIHRPHGPELVDAKIQQAMASRLTSDILSSGGFPLVFGGEHTVSLGPVRAAGTLGNIGVVQLDAHADLRNDYEENPLSHACVMRRVLDMGHPILGIGIRSMSEEETTAASDPRVVHVNPRTANTKTDWYSHLDAMPEKIYLTVDMDGFDPEDVPAVGTPEPGGLRWDPICDFLDHLFRTKDVLAADIVELMPGPKDTASLRLTTRLAAFIIGLRFSHIG